MKKRILCYGDSNTWGYIPGTGLRYEEDVRWTGVCQKALGTEYCMVEEAICGRTTVFDVPWAQCRNGLAGLSYALEAQKPLNLVILLLGTNDLVMRINRHIVLGADELVHVVQNANSIFNVELPIFPNGPKVLLVAPAPFHPVVDQRPGIPAYGKYADSCALAALYAEVAKKHGVEFLDAGQFAAASEIDGIHLTKESHHSLGLAMAEKIRTMLEERA